MDHSDETNGDVVTPECLQIDTGHVGPISAQHRNEYSTEKLIIHSNFLFTSLAYIIL